MATVGLVLITSWDQLLVIALKFSLMEDTYVSYWKITH